MQNKIITNTISFVKATLQNAEGGHDWFHIERVWKLAKTIANTEKADFFTVELASLLHDIADSKFHDGNETLGIKLASNFMESQEVHKPIRDNVLSIIKHISFKNSFNQTSFSSTEFEIVQDADRLDAMGAIGIARAFNYGGFKNRKLYDPEIKPNLNLSKEEYKNSTAPTINHFYEKLLLLKVKMNTKTGKQIAEQRHEFMIQYLDQFYNEWDGNN